MYKVLEAEFMITRKMLIVRTKRSKAWDFNFQLFVDQSTEGESGFCQNKTLWFSLLLLLLLLLSLSLSLLLLLLSLLLLLLLLLFFFPLCLLSGKGYPLSETVSLIHLFLSGERSLYIWHTPLVNLREYNPQSPTGRKRSYLQIQTFCQIYSKKILSWFPARISSVTA